jgi:hypothetical protein
MTKNLTLLILIAFTLFAKAQTPVNPSAQPFGKIDKADLEMKACDFEKDANAEILFDKGTVYFSDDLSINFERHVRIKIFNEKAKDEGDIKLTYYSINNIQSISNLQAETINLNNGNIEYIKVDKKTIFKQIFDKTRSQIAFSFPNVQAGAVIEFKYTLTSSSPFFFPDWYFQKHIPTRYSELNSVIPSTLYYKRLQMVNQPFIKNTDEIKSMANIPSVHDEPYMGSRKDNSERILFELESYNNGANSKNFSDSWTKVGENEMTNEDFGAQFKRKLSGEDIILAKAKTLVSNDNKIAYIFNEVKSAMKWNDLDERYTNDGTAEAWNKKTGNSTEINLILYHLLQKAGITVYPMLVSTRSNGKVNPGYSSIYQFNKTVAYIPIDSAKFYILDATSKYHVYNEIPNGLLNRLGFYMDKENKKYELLFLQNNIPVRQVVLITAEIKPDGKLNGTAQLSSLSYDRQNAVSRYKTDGEKKYIDYLIDGDNNLKIASVKFDNMEIDSLPLTQNINFQLNLTGSDESYIYFNPNLFTGLHSNPFLNEKRTSDIDFGYQSQYSINGIYKLPAGYKIDAMPKSVTMSMPDKSITFKRIVAEQDGSVVVRYTISYGKSIYFKEGYPEFHDFFKKMHEMLNEQVVLKKS